MFVANALALRLTRFTLLHFSMPCQIVHRRPGGKLCVGRSASHASIRASGFPTFLLIMLSALPEELIHLRDFVQDEKSTPYDCRSWWPVMLAIQIAAKHAYPHDGLLQRWNLLWQLRRAG